MWFGRKAIVSKRKKAIELENQDPAKEAVCLVLGRQILKESAKQKVAVFG